MLLENINIVMVETTHPGNIGAAARAMKTMNLSSLSLVNPQCAVDKTALVRSAGALDVLDQSQRFPDLASAIADSHLVIGTSARSRTVSWPALTPETIGEKVFSLGDDMRVSIVFGREATGLTNEELQHCHYALNIPTNPDFSSLNVASAIQIVAYELSKPVMSQNQEPASVKRSELIATSEELESFFNHLRKVLEQIGFLDPGNPRQMMKRLRRLFQRAEPNRNEVNILRGILTAVEKRR